MNCPYLRNEFLYARKTLAHNNRIYGLDHWESWGQSTYSMILILHNNDYYSYFSFVLSNLTVSSFLKLNRTDYKQWVESLIMNLIVMKLDLALRIPCHLNPLTRVLMLLKKKKKTLKSKSIQTNVAWWLWGITWRTHSYILSTTSIRSSPRMRRMSPWPFCIPLFMMVLVVFEVTLTILSLAITRLRILVWTLMMTTWCGLLWVIFHHSLILQDQVIILKRRIGL